MNDEDRTRIVRKTPVPPVSDGQTSGISESSVADDGDTQRIEAKRSAPQTPGPSLAESGVTRIYIPARREGEYNPTGGKSPGVPGVGNPADRVVGWLVVVKGPGTGRSFQIGFGMNQIGREPGNDLVLDFGDSEISRRAHAQITFDPRGLKFHATHGGGRNLTYLGGEPLLQPTELKGGEEILLGKTTLRFVPFCGENFQWDQDDR